MEHIFDELIGLQITQARWNWWEVATATAIRLAGNLATGLAIGLGVAVGIALVG